MTDFTIITLTRGLFCLVDKADYEWLSRFNWQVQCGSSTYARRNVKGPEGERTILMHRAIMNCPDDLQVDHINGFSLDNRRANLRICTYLENHRNRRRNQMDAGRDFKGVARRGKKWSSVIVMGGKSVRLGEFASPEEAARAYDEAARHHYGPRAYLNFPIQSNAPPEPFFYAQEISVCAKNLSDADKRHST